MNYPARADGVVCHTLHATGGGQSKRIVEATKRSPHLVACRSNRSAGLRGANSETGHEAGLFVSIRLWGGRRCGRRLDFLDIWAGRKLISSAPIRPHTYPGASGGKARLRDRTTGNRFVPWYASTNQGDVLQGESISKGEWAAPAHSFLFGCWRRLQQPRSTLSAPPLRIGERWDVLSEPSIWLGGSARSRPP
jgi:hypothetical protein